MLPGAERAGLFQQMCGLVAERSNIIPLASRFNVVAYRADRLTPVVQEFEPLGDYVRFIPQYVRKG
jgi:peptide/nickel transport system substrate-binding protein